MTASSRISDAAKLAVQVIALLLVLGVAGAVWFRRSVHPGFATNAAAECRVAYRRARSASDTAIIDSRTPSTTVTRDANRPTCGTLRLAGEL